MIKDRILEYVGTRHLEMQRSVENDGRVWFKIMIYGEATNFGPYLLKGKLLSSPWGVLEEDFDKSYIQNSVDAVYSTFPTEEVDKLITKLKNKKWLK